MKSARWRELAQAEQRLAAPHATVAGVDEAGRGPLAGPVVAAAVVLDLDRDWSGLHDSKQLSAQQRDASFARVLQGARAFAWAVVGPRAIDRMNIRQATHACMRRSLARLSVRPELALIDGNDPVADLVCPQRTVVSGDATCLSIAAASILAKVVRDRIMERLDRVYPQYGFAQHKGYGTAEHMSALRTHGPCALHRYSFAPVNALELPLGGEVGRA